jgi:hypothetical protein
MSLVTVSTLSEITVSHILHVENTADENHSFYIVAPDGQRTNFHWLSEPSHAERDGSERAIKGLAEALGIRYEYEEVYGDD